MTVIANPPYPSYFDVDGSPLEGGYIYFGAANQNPETNPITVYWDAAYTQPALQPIRTSGGFTYRAGTPANIYVSTDFSITVRDKNRRLVYSKLLSEGQATAEVNLQYSTQSITATAGQTVFGLSTAYTPGNNSLAVYHNGSRLIVGSDYTETSATVITLAIGATAGDVLQFVTATPINPSSLGAAAVAYIPAGPSAVATNVQAKLRETVSVRDFGAVGDGVTDDTAAIQAALSYAYSVSTPAANGWRYNTAKVVIPAGKYKIAQANALFATLSAFSGHIIGDGKSGVTELIYSVSSPAATDYMIKNDDLFGFIQFENIKFTCANANGANQNFMLYNGTTLTAQNITFNNCNFYNWTNLVRVGGPVNASENTFYNCHFYNISGVVFDLNNSQAVNWRFYACDAEIITGVLFQYTQGSMVLWSQGSIIPSGASARVLKVPSGADSNAFGPGNSPCIQFHATRFEMRTGALMAEKVNSATIFSAIFNGCDMGGLNITDPVTYKSFTWTGAGKLEFRSCSNLANHRFNYSVAGTNSHELEITFDSCSLPRTVITSSTFTVTGGSTQNIGYLPTIYVKRCGSQLDGEYKPKDSQYMNNSLVNYHGVEKTKHALSFSPEANTMAVTSGATFNVYVPSTRVIGVEVFPVANANGAIQGTITVKNAAGTVTLGTATWTMGTPASTRIAIDCNYFVDALAGDYLTVQFSHNYTPGTVLSFNGQMYLTY